MSQDRQRAFTDSSNIGKGRGQIIDYVEDLAVMEKILKHQKEQAIADKAAQSHQGRAPPQIELFERC